ncbi:MAG: DUF4417 domain-containing protein [Atopobiaceae bacterium]|nr:DUF4417 domain-containing protein [Atopobiaceae bacterium]
MQLWNVYRSRAIGCWLQYNGASFIVNVHWGDWRTHRVCCDGVSKGCTIAVGTVGALADAEDRAFFAEGLAYVVRRLAPRTIVVYGPAPDGIFGKYRDVGIDIVHFDGETSVAHSRCREVA